MYSYARKLFSLVFPHFCAGCGSECSDSALCNLCRKSAAIQTTEILRLRDLQVRYLFDYHNPLIRNLIALYKYDGIIELANFFGDQACLYLEQDKLVIDESWVITWVPLHKSRQRTRGFNQSEIIARLIGDYFGVRCEELLVKTRRSKSQATLKRSQRLDNLQGAFCIKAGVSNADRPVLLIDDVCTTGSTLKACTEVLRAAGYTKVFQLVLAKD